MDLARRRAPRGGRTGRALLVRAFLARALLSGAGSCVLVGVASLAMMLTTAPRAVNLVFEPLSLLLLPGIVVAIAWTTAQGHAHRHTRTFADNHDFSVSFVVLCTLAFYFVVLYWLLHLRARTAAQTARGTSA